MLYCMTFVQCTNHTVQSVDSSVPTAWLIIIEQVVLHLLALDAQHNQPAGLPQQPVLA